MRKAVGRASWMLGRARGLRVLPVLALLTGCDHRDPVDTPVSWWHQLEGGAIAQQRPPPPGVDDPYPKIGTTPAATPKVASVELRHSVTDHLIEQRNLNARLNAHDPVPLPVVVPGTAGARPAKASSGSVLGSNPAQSSATLDAAEAPAPKTQSTASSRATPVSSDASTGADMAMPEVVSTTAAESAVLPVIPTAPPPPPGLPGIEMPPPPSYVPPPRPDYVLTQGHGDALQFADGSDVLGNGQTGTLHAIAMHRGAAGIVYVHGYGEARSDAPQDQAQAVTLAVLRARSIADVLEKEGVPASAIRIRADAFGRGARAGLVD